MSEGKYVVFKKKDYDDWFKSYLNNNIPGKLQPIDDAVVIRRQDIFAPPALDTYANSIRVALSISPPGKINTNLADTADYFHQQAVLSWNINRKIPD